MKVPSSCLIGEEGKGFQYLMTELAQERMIVGTNSIATSEQLFEITRKYVHERQMFNGSMMQFQTVKHKLAEMK